MVAREDLELRGGAAGGAAGGLRRSFRAGERIFMEQSRKFDEERRLASAPPSHPVPHPHLVKPNHPKPSPNPSRTLKPNPNRNPGSTRNRFIQSPTSGAYPRLRCRGGLGALALLVG